jgi:hypothetical protein
MSKPTASADVCYVPADGTAVAPQPVCSFVPKIKGTGNKISNLTSADVVFAPDGGETQAYVAQPYEPTTFQPEDYSNHNKEGLSIMVSSRVDKNPDSNIFRLLDSAVACVHEEDYGKIEFILKYDFDDAKRPDPKAFEKYPFAVKMFVYERGEGRHYNHHFSEYGFANRNTSFRWAASMADDFYFTRKGFYKELEAIKTNTWLWATPARPSS